MKTNILFKILLTIFFYSFNSYAQKVSNISFVQEQSNIIISYDLETKTPCKVSLFVSTDDGKTWQGPLKKVVGDAGAKIASGYHSISWNVLEEFQELKGDNIKFQVRADLTSIETVIIGTQEWTTKNLNVSKYRNGDEIPEVKDPEKWKNLTTGAYCYYNNDFNNGEIYGKLYNWYAINDPRGLAPEGFHISSDSEWDKLIDYLGANAGGKIKSTGITQWKSPNKFAINSIGFSGLPGGFRNYLGTFTNIGLNGMWWTSSENSITTAWNRFVNYGTGNAESTNWGKTDGFSVRCIGN